MKEVEGRGHAFRMARLVAQQIDDEIMEALSALERAVASESFDLVDGDPQPERHILRDLQRRDIFNGDVFIADKDGIVRLAEPDPTSMVGTDLSDYANVLAALETGQPQVSNLIFGAGLSKPLLLFVFPVTAETGSVVGLVGAIAEPPAPFLADATSGLRAPTVGYVDVVDANGVVLYSTTVDSTLLTCQD